ncbi:MAG: DUF1460 domain-containing protein [Candidatus Eisenbacteria sp.]|nr:DUF1460 domain-containing protein [Candidatus Eisenbacteria bacterium]
MRRAAGYAIAVIVLVVALVLVIPPGRRHWRAPEKMLTEPRELFTGPSIYRMTDAELDNFLRELSEKGAPFFDRMRILALGRIGTPYERGCLGEEDGFDPDPIFRIDRTDCTVFILTQAAMVHASSLEQARSNMLPANYRPVVGSNRVTYENRLHFTVDRLGSSPYFRDVTRIIARGAPLKEATVVLNRKADGTSLLPVPWEREVTIAYFSVEDLDRRVLGRLPPVVGAALVREKQFEIGVIAAHEGIILDRRDFVHASSTAGEVVKVPFMQYLLPEDEPPRFDGVIFYEFR